jgi:hypothetical protein
MRGRSEQCERPKVGADPPLRSMTAAAHSSTLKWLRNVGRSGRLALNDIPQGGLTMT